MDTTAAHWHFILFPQGYGLRIQLAKPEHVGIENAAAVAVVQPDCSAEQLSATLHALEEAYEQLPEPAPAPAQDGLIAPENA